MLNGIFGHTKTKFELLANEFGKERREKALNDLATGKTKLLLATDLAARGLDIPGLTYVINFDIPSETNTYMHRAGVSLYTSSYDFAETCVFDKQLFGPIHCGWLLRQHPFSRSYGVILPSSLTRVLSLALVFSTRLPVSVCGTGTFDLARSFSWQCDS